MDSISLNAQIKLINGDMIKAYQDWREIWFRVTKMMKDNQYWIDKCVQQWGYCAFTADSLNNDLEMKRKQAVEEISKYRKALKFPVDVNENKTLFINVVEEPEEIWMIKTNLVDYDWRMEHYWGVDEEIFKKFIEGH